jgi:dynein light intermediate chain 1
VIPPLQYSTLLKPNVIDRDTVFVPSGWDSWGKIRVLRDGFDVEGVCTGWSVDLASILGKQDSSETIGGALEVYEDTIADPKRVGHSTTVNIDYLGFHSGV